MRKNQDGFSVVEIVLVIVVVGLIGGVGWYVWQSKNKETKTGVNNQSSTTQQTNKETPQTQESKDETEKWASFTPNNKLYTIKLPDGWTFLHQNDDCDCLYSQTTDFKVGTPATIGKTQGGRDGIFGYFIVADDNDKSGERFQSFQKQGTIMAGNMEGTKYYYEQTSELEGIGLEKGGKEYAYYFVKNGRGIYLSYSINPGTTNNVELVEKTVKTLR